MDPRLRILITRTRHQASALAEKLEALGTETLLVPTIELAPPSSYEALDAALDSLGNPSNSVDWLLFTSGNAVDAFEQRRARKGIEIYPERIAVIGPGTAEALSRAGITPRTGPVLIPERFVAESLAASLLDLAGSSPKRFLLIRAEEARDVIPRTLGAGGHRVTIAPAYRNVIPEGAVQALQSIFASPETSPAMVTFTSSSTVRNLFNLLDRAAIVLPVGVLLASIGPVTSATLRDLGHEPSFEAAEPTIEAFVEAIAAHLDAKRQLGFKGS